MVKYYNYCGIIEEKKEKRKKKKKKREKKEKKEKKNYCGTLVGSASCTKTACGCHDVSFLSSMC